MIQRSAKADDTMNNISSKDALNIVKGIYKGMKDLPFFTVYSRTLQELPANPNFQVKIQNRIEKNLLDTK